MTGVAADNSTQLLWTGLGCPELDGSWVSRALAALNINLYFD